MNKRGQILYLSENFIVKKGKVSLGIYVRFSINRKNRELKSLVFTPFIEIRKKITFNGKLHTKQTKILGNESLHYCYIVEIYKVWRILSLIKRQQSINSPLIVKLEQLLEKKASLQNILQTLPEEIDVEELKRIITELPEELKIDTSTYEFGKLSDFVIINPANKPLSVEEVIKISKDGAATYAYMRGLEIVKRTKSNPND